MRRLLFGGIVGLVFGLASLTGCNGEKSPTIVCTMTIVADVVKNVAGQHQDVAVLMGEDVDPHTYDPTTSDARKLSSAKLIFYSGLHLEGKMTDLLEEMAKKKPVHALTGRLTDDKILRDDKGTKDPHVWFDVALWSETVDVVRDALSEFDPAHADDYRANAKAYKLKLARLHDCVRKELATIPRERRILVTAHDAFEYFGRAYDINVRAVQGISTDSEASVREVRDLVRFVTRHKLKAIFVESSVSDKNLKAIQEGCKAAGHEVLIGGMLYSDALGKEGTPEGTYEGMIRHNVRTIVEALR